MVHLYTKSHSAFDYVTVLAPIKKQGGSTKGLNSLTAKLQTLEKQAGIENGSCNARKCSYECVKHFFQQYGDSHQHLPFWMFAEITDFGYMGLFYRSLYKSQANGICSQLATIWDITPETLESWLTCINTLRNTCAHHGRVWNNGWGLKPKLPKRNEKGRRDWYKVYSTERQKWINPKGASPKLGFDQSKTGVLLFICRYLIKKIAPQSQWHVRVEELFKEFESCGINFRSMGLPEHWQEHPLWKDDDAVQVKLNLKDEILWRIEKAAEQEGLTPSEWASKKIIESMKQVQAYAQKNKISEVQAFKELYPQEGWVSKRPLCIKATFQRE